ncbi:MAG: aminotransferase class V-fold PLP-dependent enzyme [Gemmatimonadaceae bacterium]|nr:aminotransferase class V-fold PLP-dependent enzyme [Gemmatimonadaceae bacterium]
MTDDHTSRRAFLLSLSAVSAAGFVPPINFSSQAESFHQRGLAGADDFGFAPGLTYLQTGSLGPTPKPVMAKMWAWWQELERNPAAYAYGAHEQAMERVRGNAAAFIGCATDELVLTNCTTEGINWIAQGLTLAAGDHVLTTDQEHPGGRVAWDYLVRTKGIVLDVVQIAPDAHDVRAIVDAFAARITPRTKVLAFSHVLTSSGLRMPVAELCALARSQRCVSVVDGAQAVGAIAVDVKQLGCDAYATSGHKWLLAPKGTGLLYLNRSLGDAIDPIALQSGRLAYSASSGVCSVPSVLGLGAAIDYQRAIGVAAIEAHNLQLRARLYGALRQVPQVKIVSVVAGAQATPMLTYALPSAVSAGAMHGVLRNTHQIEVKVVPGNFLNGHRISTHLFNTERDVDHFVQTLRTLLV